MPSITAASSTSWSRWPPTSPAPSTARPHRAGNQPNAEPAAKPAPAADPTIAFDRIARTIRRTIALARKITDPAPPRPAAQAAERSNERRRIARKQIIREVEDTIQRRTDGADAEALQAEFYERLETIDCEDDIANLPIAELIALIRRDLGLAHLPGTHPWKRRTPQDVMDLRARAAGPRTTQPKTAQPKPAQPERLSPAPRGHAPSPRRPRPPGTAPAPHHPDPAPQPRRRKARGVQGPCLLV